MGTNASPTAKPNRLAFKTLQPSSRLRCDCCQNMADRHYPAENAFVCAEHHNTRGALYVALYERKYGGAPSWDRVSL